MKLKKVTSIFLIFVFGVYGLTSKTHYCFNQDGSRFHGNCKAEQKEAAKKGAANTSNLFPDKYVCIDIAKDVNIQKANAPSFHKISSTDVLLLTERLEYTSYGGSADNNILPGHIPRCCPPFRSNSLRAPPVV